MKYFSRFFEKSCGQPSPFNTWGIGPTILLVFGNQVARFCHIGNATELFSEEKVYKVVILINLGVHAELSVQAKKKI